MDYYPLSLSPTLRLHANPCTHPTQPPPIPPPAHLNLLYTFIGVNYYRIQIYKYMHIIHTRRRGNFSFDITMHKVYRVVKSANACIKCKILLSDKINGKYKSTQWIGISAKWTSQKCWIFFVSQVCWEVIPVERFHCTATSLHSLFLCGSTTIHSVFNLFGPYISFHCGQSIKTRFLLFSISLYARTCAFTFSIAFQSTAVVSFILFQKCETGCELKYITVLFYTSDTRRLKHEILNCSDPIVQLFCLPWMDLHSLQFRRSPNVTGGEGGALECTTAESPQGSHCLGVGGGHCGFGGGRGRGADLHPHWKLTQAFIQHAPRQLSPRTQLFLMLPAPAETPEP